MKKRVCSFLLALTVMAAQMSGVVVAAEPAGVTAAEEASHEEPTAFEEPAAVEEAAAEEIIEEAVTEEAAQTSEAAKEDAEVPAKAHADEPEIPAEDPDDIAEEPEATETSNDPAGEVLTSAEVYFRAPETGRSAASTNAVPLIDIMRGAKYRVSSAQWVTDAGGETEFTGIFAEGQTHYVKFVLSTNNGEQFILGKDDVEVRYATLESVSCLNEAYVGHATIILSFTPKAGNWTEEVKLSVTGPAVGKTSSQVSALSCLKKTDSTDITIESARWVSTATYSYNPTWTGTFNSTDTYYIEVKLVDGGDDRIAAMAGGSSFDTELTVSGGTVEIVGNGAETTEDGKARCMIEAVLSVKAASQDTGYADVYIDNTEDTSRSTVSGLVHLTGNVGTEAGYNPGKTVYGPVTITEGVKYSTPKPEAVQAEVDAAKETVRALANKVKAKGTSGEFHISESQTVGKVWDNRKYQTDCAVTGPGIAKPIPVTWVSEDTYEDEQGNVYTPQDYRIMRTHIASGNYGKETFFKVEANGYVSAQKPGKSGKVTVYNVAQGIKVTWLKVDGATSYYIYRDNLDGKGYKFLFRTSALEVTDLEVRYELGKKFRYKVLATNKYAGDADGFRTATYYRLMPTGITSVTNSGAGKMTVTYDKSSGGSGYVVRYGLKKDMSDAKVITVKGENTTSRTFSGLTKGKTYYVQVRTYKIEDGIRYYSGYCLTKNVKIAK